MVNTRALRIFDSAYCRGYRRIVAGWRLFNEPRTESDDIVDQGRGPNRREAAHLHELGDIELG